MTLLPAHLAALHASAISDQIITERGYQTITSALDYETTYAGSAYDGLWNRRTLKAILDQGLALLIPTYPTGEPSTHCTLRPDIPRVFANGHSPKYEQPAKIKPVLDILPRYRPFLADTSIPVWITEGAKKADALASLFDMAILPISINGVNGWSSSGMLKDFDQLQFRPRHVIFAPDGDIQSNQYVALALDRLNAALERRGATLFLALLPDNGQGQKIGIDDYIAMGHNQADVQALILPWVQAAQAIAASLKAHGVGTDATIEQMIDTWAAERDDWAYDADRDAFYHWRGTHWEQAKQIDIDAKCAALLKDAGRDTKGGAANDIQRFVKPKLARIFKSHEGLANFLNGTYDATTGQVRPHDRNDGLTSCLPFDFDLDLDFPITQGFLEQTIPDPVARVCYMVFVGLAILGDTTRHNFLTLIGATRSGKSTLLGLAQYIAGNTESPMSFAGASLLSDETEGKRARFQWVNHRMVAIDELKSEVMMKAEEKLKILSAHGGAEMRGMNKDEQMRNRWLPKLLMAANDTPRFMDNSGALQARMRVVRCPNSQEGYENFGLFAQLQAEAGVFASVCTGLAAGVLFHGLPVPEGPAMKEQKDELGQQNPLKMFANEGVIFGSVETCDPKEFRAAYLIFCEDHGYKPMADGRLLSALKDCGYAVDNTTRWTHTTRLYSGMRLRTVYDPPQGATFATSLPQHFLDLCGTVLGDWKAIKHASATFATYKSPMSFILKSLCMYDMLTCLHTYMAPLRKGHARKCCGKCGTSGVCPLLEPIKPCHISAISDVATCGKCGNVSADALAAYDAGTIRAWCLAEGQDYETTLDSILELRKNGGS